MRQPTPRHLWFAALTLGLTSLLIATVGFVYVLETKQTLLSTPRQYTSEAAANVAPFPVSVDPVAQVIEEDPQFTRFYRETLAQTADLPDRGTWQGALTAGLLQYDWFQQLAAPVSRVVVIWPGEREAQVVDSIGDILRWDATERETFTRLMASSSPTPVAEGTYYPGRYITHRYATPHDLHELISQRFQTDIATRYTPAVEARVPLADALIIASLIEREASDFTNMREVSGVIWNRLFIDMPLQLDATLQYVRGSDPYEPAWWPAVRPADKFLSSPFNTYEQAGLPPAPIANPSLAAVLAALNPIQTDCLYYFHTERGEYVCTTTYEEHVQELRARYGRSS